MPSAGVACGTSQPIPAGWSQIAGAAMQVCGGNAASPFFGNTAVIRSRGTAGALYWGICADGAACNGGVASVSHGCEIEFAGSWASGSTDNNDQRFGPSARSLPGARYGYVWGLDMRSGSGPSLRFYRITGTNPGAATTPVAGVVIPGGITAGDLLRIEAVDDGLGNTVVSGFYNGVLLSSFVDAAPFSAGFPGIGSGPTVGSADENESYFSRWSAFII